MIVVKVYYFNYPGTMIIKRCKDPGFTTSSELSLETSKNHFMNFHDYMSTLHIAELRCHFFRISFTDWKTNIVSISLVKIKTFIFIFESHTHIMHNHTISSSSTFAFSDSTLESSSTTSIFLILYQNYLSSS